MLNHISASISPCCIKCNLASLHSTVSKVSDCRSKDHKFEPQSSHITLMEIEIISMVILLQIQEELLSVTDESIITKYWLTALRTKHAQGSVSRSTD